MTKSFPYPRCSMNIRRKKAAVEWNVPTMGNLFSRNGLIHSGFIQSFFAILSRISLAALLVNVTQNMERGSMWCSCIIDTTRSVIVWVFPDQAQALMRSGPWMVCTASCCCGLRFDMLGSIEKSPKKSRILFIFVKYHSVYILLILLLYMNFL